MVRQLLGGLLLSGLRRGLADEPFAAWRGSSGTAIGFREQNHLGRTPARKNEQATAQEQSASLINAFHGRIVAAAGGGECRVQTLLEVSQLGV